MGTQVQAHGPSDQGGKGLVRSAAPCEPQALRSLATMPWRRPNIGSRVTREGHARFWERLGVKLPWATRQKEKLNQRSGRVSTSPEICRPIAAQQSLTVSGQIFGTLSSV